MTLTPLHAFFWADNPEPDRNKVAYPSLEPLPLPGRVYHTNDVTN